MKKNRKAKQFYSLLNKDGVEVNIDLNNYKVTCTVTGNRKSFYHKYLHNMIVTKFDNNIDLFRDTYVSREAAPSKNERKAERLQDRINVLLYKVKELKAQKAELAGS
jgi:hypothetical protein